MTVGTAQDISDSFEFASFWRRVAAALVDFIVFLPLVIPLMDVHNWILEHRTIWPALVVPALATTLNLWLVMRFGGTVGKLVVGIRIVDSTGNLLPFDRAVRRIAPDLIITGNQILLLHNVASRFPGFAGEPNSEQFMTALATFGGAFWTASEWMKWFPFLDLAAILVNRKRRAIHDFLAGSFVVTRSSFAQLSGAFRPRAAG